MTWELRRHLESIWSAALQELDPALLVSTALRSTFATPDRTTPILAVGKAAPAMAAGAAIALGDDVHGIIVTTDGAPGRDLPKALRTLRASHPVPDARSIEAAQQALELARESNGGLLVLVSGGSSALLCAPRHMALEDKRAMTDELLRSGASIHELNTVRRHVSEVKGGGLAIECPGPVVSLIISDVIGGAPHDVGSGPACVDPTTVDDAIRIIRERLHGALASRCAAACEETLKPGDPRAPAVTSILAGPGDLARAFAQQLQSRGWRAEHDVVVDASAEALSSLLTRRARRLDRASAWVVACEPTLRVPKGSGRGGRAGWVALHAACDLPPDTLLWAAASDGVDGSSGNSGACIWSTLASAMSRAAIAATLDARDDAPVHESLGSALRTGATGLNMTDLYAVIRA